LAFACFSPRFEQEAWMVLFMDVLRGLSYLAGLPKR